MSKELHIPISFNSSDSSRPSDKEILRTRLNEAQSIEDAEPIERCASEKMLATIDLLNGRIAALEALVRRLDAKIDKTSEGDIGGIAKRLAKAERRISRLRWHVGILMPFTAPFVILFKYGRAALEKATSRELRLDVSPAPATGYSLSLPRDRNVRGETLLPTRFIGYAEGNLGLGQSFRDDVIAARMVGVPVNIYPFNVAIETRLIGPFLPELYDTTAVYPINVIIVAPDQVPNIFKDIPRNVIGNSYNILRTYWELPDAPDEWRGYLTDINELWAPNDFVADAFRDIFAGPIKIVPTTVDVTIDKSFDRVSLGLDEERFYFLYSFDYFSSPYRKNPVGLLHAFQQAFPDRHEKVGLVLKSIGPEQNYPDVRSVIETAMKADPRIVRIDRTLVRDEMLSLIKVSDAYISLHRSEGFGAGMAEAMMMGKIVIGTDFSGSRCFLNRDTGFPVPYTLRAVEPHEYPWSSGQVWGEPVISEAARLMRHVFEQTNVAQKKAIVGEQFIKATFSRDAVGGAIRNRLAELSQTPRLPKQCSVDVKGEDERALRRFRQFLGQR